MSKILSQLLRPEFIQSALIRSPTQKVGMGLVAKLQIMQQLTTIVTFF